MVRNTIYYVVFVFLSVTVKVKSQICYGTSQYDPCSTNSACGCFHMLGANDTGICGFLWVSCVQLVPCDSSSNACHKSDSICIRHPRCYDVPVCYPVSMIDERICPPIATTNTTTTTTTIPSTTTQHSVDFDGNVHIHGISIDGEEENGLRLSINVTIENPDVIDIQLKNFSFYIAEEENDIILGRILISVLSLQPGNNTVILNGVLAPLHETDLSTIGKFFSMYLNGQTQIVKLFHNQSFEPDTTVIDFTIKTNLDGIKTKLIRQIDVLNFGIEFDSINVKKVYVTSQLSVLSALPSNIQMTFKALTTSINVTMRFNDGPRISQMILHDVPIEHNQTTNELLISFDKQQLIILDDTSFPEFAANLFHTSNVSVTIEGLSAVLVEVQIGNITLFDIPINDTFHLVGYNQFDNKLLNIDNMDLIEALSSHELAFRAVIEIINPSVVNIVHGGRLSLDLCEMSSGISLGLVIIDPFYLEPQDNKTTLNVEGSFLIAEENFAVVQQFVSRMISDIDNDVELRGTLTNHSIGTSIPLLSMAVANLRIHTQVLGLSSDRTLVRKFLFKKLSATQIASITIGLVKTFSLRIHLKNPFRATLNITGMNIRVDLGRVINGSEQVGIVTDNSSITIGAYEEALTPYIDMNLTAKLTTLASLLSPLLAGTIRLSLSGFINVTIGDQLTLDQLPLTLLNISGAQDSLM